MPECQELQNNDAGHAQAEGQLVYELHLSKMTIILNYLFVAEQTGREKVAKRPLQCSKPVLGIRDI